MKKNVLIYTSLILLIIGFIVTYHAVVPKGHIQKNKKASVLDKAVINVALSAAKAQSIAYIFGREAQNAYQLLNASPVSEIGTVTIQADTNQEYLILY